MNRLIPVFVGMAVTCFGCIPIPMTDTPALRGEVLDRETQAPIGDATVEVGSMSEKPGGAHVRTDANGRFLIEETSHTAWIFPAPYDTAIIDTTVEVSAAGYDDLRTEYNALTRAGGPRREVIIYLTRHRNS